MNADEAMQRAISFLYYDEEWDEQDIADFCGVPVSMVSIIAAAGLALRAVERIQEMNELFKAQKRINRVKMCGRVDL